jgi:hypothetical protein
MRYKYLIVLLFLLISCASKKESKKVVYKDREVIKKEYVSQPIKTDYNFKLECDSLGNVKPISFIKSSGVNKADFNIEGNVLDIRLLTGESRDTSIKETSSSDTEVREKKTIYVTPFWVYPTFISLILIIIGLVKLASTQLLGFVTKLKFW